MLVLTVLGWTILSSLIGHGYTFTVMHRSGVEQLEDTVQDVDDASPYEYMDSVAKREQKGTCTCTCETKPVVVAAPQMQKIPEQRPPETASLMRTATVVRPDASKNSKSTFTGTSSNSKGKTSTSGNNKQNVVVPESKDSDFSKIVKVPPPEDFELSSNDQSYGGSEPTYDEPEAKAPIKPLDKLQESWGHGSRYPWKRLPDTICFREPCHSDKDCCLRYNICDRSARVCVDCWYGSTCSSERDCCLKYPYCQKTTRNSQEDGTQVVEGKCVNEL